MICGCLEAAIVRDASVGCAGAFNDETTVIDGDWSPNRIIVSLRRASISLRYRWTKKLLVNEGAGQCKSNCVD